MGDEWGVKEGARIWWRPLQLQVKAGPLGHNQFLKQNPAFCLALRRRLSWVLAPLCKSRTNTCINVTYSSCKGTYSNKGGFWSFLILWVPWSGVGRASKGGVSCYFAPVSLPSVCLLFPNASPPFSFVRMNHTFPRKLQQQAALFLF